MNPDPTENVLNSLVERVAELSSTTANIPPIDVEISMSIANDLMALDAEAWRIGSNGSMQDDQIDNLLSQIFRFGSSSLNSLIVRGIIITVTADQNFTGIRIV